MILVPPPSFSPGQGPLAMPSPTTPSPTNHKKRPPKQQVGKYKVDIKAADMPPVMVESVLSVARRVLDEYGTDKSSNEQGTAIALKENFEVNYPGDWHCIVGRNFGHAVTGEIGNFIYFFMGPKNILLYGTSCSVDRIKRHMNNGASGRDDNNDYEDLLHGYLCQELGVKDAKIKELKKEIRLLQDQQEQHGMIINHQGSSSTSFNEQNQNLASRVTALEMAVKELQKPLIPASST